MARHAGRPKQKKNLYLRSDICERIDLLLTPRGESKVPHGAWTDLVEKLLRQHYRELPDHTQSYIELRLEDLKRARTKSVLELME